METNVSIAELLRLGALVLSDSVLPEESLKAAEAFATHLDLLLAELPLKSIKREELESLIAIHSKILEKTTSDRMIAKSALKKLSNKVNGIRAYLEHEQAPLKK